MYQEFIDRRRASGGFVCAESMSVPLSYEGEARLFSALRNAPPRSFSGYVVRFFYDLKNGFSLDLEKKYAEPLDKQGADVLSLILTDMSEIHIMPSGDKPGAEVCLLLKGGMSESLETVCSGLKAAVLQLIRQYSEV